VNQAIAQVVSTSKIVFLHDPFSLHSTRVAIWSMA